MLAQEDLRDGAIAKHDKDKDAPELGKGLAQDEADARPQVLLHGMHVVFFGDGRFMVET